MEEVYVFGDQTADLRAFFTKVFSRKDDVLLQSFLERTGEAVRSENKYRTHPSKAVPNFNTIQELVDRYYRGEGRDLAIESALVSIAQFTHFIGYVQEVAPESRAPKTDHNNIVLSKREHPHTFNLIQTHDWSAFAPA
jgi:glycerophosphoryl diester phosphodiesterase